MSDANSLIQLGTVGAPFGVRGWVKLRSHTDPPERLLEHRKLTLGHDAQWREFRVMERGRSGGALTVKFEGIEDRDQAMGLRGYQVCVPRASLPPTEQKDFYRADLIGCTVVTVGGEPLGVLTHFVDTPAQALMVVRGEREHWVPAAPPHLRRVELDARRVVVDWDPSSA